MRANGTTANLKDSAETTTQLEVITTGLLLQGYLTDMEGSSMPTGTTIKVKSSLVVETAKECTSQATSYFEDTSKTMFSMDREKRKAATIFSKESTNMGRKNMES